MHLREQVEFVFVDVDESDEMYEVRDIDRRINRRTTLILTHGGKDAPLPGNHPATIIGKVLQELINTTFLAYPGSPLNRDLTCCFQTGRLVLMCPHSKLQNSQPKTSQYSSCLSDLSYQACTMHCTVLNTSRTVYPSEGQDRSRVVTKACC